MELPPLPAKEKRTHLANGEAKLNKYGFIHVPKDFIEKLPFAVDQPLKLAVANGALQIRAA